MDAKQINTMRSRVMSERVRARGLTRSQVMHLRQATQYNVACDGAEVTARDGETKIGATYVEASREAWLDLAVQLDTMAEAEQAQLDGDVEFGQHTPLTQRTAEQTIACLRRLEILATTTADTLWEAEGIVPVGDRFRRARCVARLHGEGYGFGVAFSGTTGGHGVPLTEESDLDRARVHWVGYCANNGVAA